jgi:hypothetical protein
VSALRRCSTAAPGQLQGLLPRGQFQSFQIQVFHRLTVTEPCRWSARLKVESELLTGAANAIVKT